MMKCHDCNTTIKNKTKHEQTKKHNFFSNLVSNKYVIKDVYTNKFKYVITSYYNEHIKKFDIFTVCVYWKVDDMMDYKKSRPKILSYGVTVHGYPIFINETACDFLHRVITNYLTHGELSIDKIQQTEIVFISDIKDMTYPCYMEQPKSITCRKMVGRFVEVKSEDNIHFEYIWLPSCLCE